MDFNMSKDQVEICTAIKNLCQDYLNDNIFEHDKQEVFSHNKWNLCAKFGIHGLPIPEEYGGCGHDMLTTALAIKALAQWCRDEGIIVSIIAHIVTCAVPIWKFGSEEQKKKYLPKIASGELIGGSGITEPDSGSDLSALNTKAVKSEGYFVLDGNKIFVTNAPVADILIIYARHPGGLKMLDISGFILEKTDGNYKVGQVFEKMGLRTSPISEVVLDNCKVLACRVLGRERLGMTIFNESMLWERILMGAYHVGAMEQQYAEVLKYANSRKQFGKKIIEFEAVYDKLIDMKIRIENAKLLLYRTCWDFDNGKRDAADVSMLKLYTSESKVKNSLNAVQTFGAYGYMKETFVEKQLRDSIAAKIYSGTSEIQKMIIAKSLEEGNG